MARDINELKKAQNYFEESVRAAWFALSKVQDAWFCVEEVLDGDAAGEEVCYEDGYPFDDDIGTIIYRIAIWESKCKSENRKRIEGSEE